jgi:hypothetical protein
MTNLTPAAAAARETARSATGQFGEQRRPDAANQLAAAVQTRAHNPGDFDTVDAVRLAASVHTDESAAKGSAYVLASTDLIARLISDGRTEEELEQTRQTVWKDITEGTTKADARHHTYGMDTDRVIEEARGMVGRTYEGFADVDVLPPHYWDGLITTATALATGPDDDPDEMRREHEIHTRLLSWGR